MNHYYNVIHWNEWDEEGSPVQTCTDHWFKRKSGSNAIISLCGTHGLSVNSHNITMIRNASFVACTTCSGLYPLELLDDLDI